MMQHIAANVEPLPENMALGLDPKINEVKQTCRADGVHAY